MAEEIKKEPAKDLEGEVWLGKVLCDLLAIRGDGTLVCLGYGNSTVEWSILDIDPWSDLTESKRFLDERDQATFNTFVGLPNIYKTLGLPQDSKRSWECVEIKEYIEEFNARPDKSHKLNEFITNGFLTGGWLYCSNMNGYHNPDMKDKLIKTRL